MVHTRDFTGRLEPHALASAVSPECDPSAEPAAGAVGSKGYRPLVIRAIAVFVVSTCLTNAASAKEPTTRRFRFDYGVKIKSLPAGKTIRVWLPMPQSDSHQVIERVRLDAPGEPQINVEQKYGNKILYLEQTASPKFNAKGLSLSASYWVLRNEVRGLHGRHAVGSFASNDVLRTALQDSKRKLFLSPNSKVPIDGKPLELLADLPLPEDPLNLARLLYRRVDEHVKYDKSKPGYGRGDSSWVCDSRFGNCTDFHSLFISLARSRNIPARFEIGFPLPPRQSSSKNARNNTGGNTGRNTGNISGYHCWALFFLEGAGWIPVDISEADKHPAMKDYYFGNLTADRLAFTTGRDINLVPRQDGAPLNFFVYPYVEVNGRVWPPEKIQLEFTFTDQP